MLLHTCLVHSQSENMWCWTLDAGSIRCHCKAPAWSSSPSNHCPLYSQSAEPCSSARKIAHASHCPGSVTGSLTVSMAAMKSSAKKVGRPCPRSPRRPKGVKATPIATKVPVFLSQSYQPTVHTSAYSVVCSEVHPSIYPSMYSTINFNYLTSIHPSTHLLVIHPSIFASDTPFPSSVSHSPLLIHQSTYLATIFLYTHPPF